MLNYLIIGLIILLVVVAGRKTLRDLKSTRCSGCSNKCQSFQPVTISLKKNSD